MSIAKLHRILNSRASSQRGLTLVEILVAMAIALFLLGGLLTLVQNTRKTYGAQNQMAQLQDNQRLAMTLIGSVVEAAGYFPDPTTNTATGTLPATGAFTAAGQSIVGAPNTAGPGDTITVRYMAGRKALVGDSDAIINCTGGTNTTPDNLLYVNKFSIVDLVSADGKDHFYLACALSSYDGAGNLKANNPAIPLVSGLQTMQISYGVKTDFSADNGAVDRYLTTNQMTATNWNNVISVKVKLTFVNPLAPGQNQPATIVFERVIGVMNRAGVKT